jgi:hypothetical protein
MDELVDPYRVASSTKLENSFLGIENTCVDVVVDIDKLNVILNASGHTKVDDDDNDIDLEFNEKDNDGYDNDENENKDFD